MTLPVAMPCHPGAGTTAGPTTTSPESVTMSRRPAQWDLHTIPADVAARLPYQLREALEEMLTFRATPRSRRAADREYAAQCRAALDALHTA